MEDDVNFVDKIVQTQTSQRRSQFIHNKGSPL